IFGRSLFFGGSCLFCWCRFFGRRCLFSRSCIFGRCSFVGWSSIISRRSLVGGGCFIGRSFFLGTGFRKRSRGSREGTQIGDYVGTILDLLKTCKGHRGARNVSLWIEQEAIEVLVIPHHRTAFG